MTNLQTIGKQVKRLRKEKGVTQEQLAETLGVSCQAVSKWETGVTLPDIASLPALADYFRVSIDQLFGYDRRERERAVLEIVDTAWRGYRSKGDCPGARGVLEEGLKRFPNDDVLLNNMLCTIDPEQEPEELIALAQTLIAQTQDDSVKYDALRLLAMAYAAKGDPAACAAALEQIPEIYFTKLEWQAKLLHGPAKEEAARKQKWISLECMCDMMNALAQCHLAAGSAAAAQTELAAARAALDLIVPSDTSQHSAWRAERFAEYRNREFAPAAPAVRL